MRQAIFLTFAIVPVVLIIICKAMEAAFGGIILLLAYALGYGDLVETKLKELK